MVSADVTRRELILGACDDTTGWYAKDLSNETTIKMVIRPRGSSLFIGGFGYYAKYLQTGFTEDIVEAGDEIIDDNGNYYEGETVDEEWVFNAFSHRVCNLVKRVPHADRPATYGTGATIEDPRSRSKVWLDAHLDPGDAYLTKDDGVTPAFHQTFFATPDYPLPLIFDPTEKNVDLAFAIHMPESKPLFNYDHSPYGYEENVPISIITVDKIGITATNLEWKAQQELRRIAEIVAGSLRQIQAMRPTSQDLGGLRIYSSEYILNYRRSSGTVPTVPSITWGDWCGEGEPGGLDGTFIFPNVMRIEYPNGVPNVKLLPPGRVGNISQRLGDTSLVVRLTCDLDVSNYPTLTWKRSGMGDPERWWFINDIKHYGGIDQPYQTLKLGWGANKGFKVTLEDFDVRQEGENTVLEITFQEYNPTSAVGQTVAQRYGVS